MHFYSFFSVNDFGRSWFLVWQLWPLASASQDRAKNCPNSLKHLPEPVDAVFNMYTLYMLKNRSFVVYGHITLKTPVLVRSPKVSNVEPGVTAWEYRVQWTFVFYFLFSLFIFLSLLLSYFYFIFFSLIVFCSYYFCINKHEFFNSEQKNRFLQCWSIFWWPLILYSPIQKQW